MSYADLRGADLTAADLQQAVAEGVDLTGATLDGAIMVAAHDSFCPPALGGPDRQRWLPASPFQALRSLGREASRGAELGDGRLDHANLAGASVCQRRRAANFRRDAGFVPAPAA